MQERELNWRRDPLCLRRCWCWDLMEACFPDRAARLEAARRTLGIWARLPAWVQEELCRPEERGG